MKLSKETLSYLKETGVLISTFYVAYKLGCYCQTKCEKLPIASWKTPNFTGNNGRSMIYPYRDAPFIDDHEEFVDKLREDMTLKNEILTTYKIVNFSGWVHPQREESDYSLLSDAEYQQDIQKLLDEQRHEVAIECVQKGIYKDVIEAKQMQRGKRIEHSTYIYKDLLFRV